MEACHARFARENSQEQNQRKELDKMASKGKEPPQFIIFGAQVFASLLVGAGLEGPVTPETLRRLKMNQQSLEDEEMVIKVLFLELH